MLVLGRREGETIQIGPDITITVVRTAGYVVKIGINAPRSLTITRPEKHGPMEPRPEKRTCTQCGDEFVDESDWRACPGCRLSWVGPDLAAIS